MRMEGSTPKGEMNSNSQLSICLDCFHYGHNGLYKQPSALKPHLRTNDNTTTTTTNDNNQELKAQCNCQLFILEAKRYKSNNVRNGTYTFRHFLFKKITRNVSVNGHMQRSAPYYMAVTSLNLISDMDSGCEIRAN